MKVIHMARFVSITTLWIVSRVPRLGAEAVIEILTLRRAGWSYQALADKYSCPKLRIRYICKRHDLGAGTVSVVVTRADLPTSRKHTKPPEFTNELGERINQGKTYKEYLFIEAERKKNATMLWKRS